MASSSPVYFDSRQISFHAPKLNHKLQLLISPPFFYFTFAVGLSLCTCKLCNIRKKRKHRMWRKNAAERVVDQGQRDRQEKGHASKSRSTIGNQCSCESFARAGKKRLNGLALQRSQFPRCDLWVMPLVTYTKGWELMEASSFSSSFLPVQVINQTPPKPSNFLEAHKTDALQSCELLLLVENVIRWS